MKVERVCTYRMCPQHFLDLPAANSHSKELPLKTVFMGGELVRQVLGNEVFEFLRLKYNLPFFVRDGNEMVLMCWQRRTVPVLSGRVGFGDPVSAEIDGRIIEGNVYRIIPDDLDGDFRVLVEDHESHELVECPPEKLVRLL